MFQKIGLSLDTSEEGQSSQGVAQSWAEAFGADLVGLNASGSSAQAERLSRLTELLPEEDRPAVTEETSGYGVKAADPSDYAFPVLNVEGRPATALVKELGGEKYDLLVMGGRRAGEPAEPVGPLCERILRTSEVDTLVVKEEFATDGDGKILVCVDGSHQSYAGLKVAIELGKKFNRTVEAVGVYDPYLHYTLFNGIVNVLSAKAAAIFKFADQEKLHEEIIDTGLAKIYQAHLEVAQKVAEEDGVSLKATLLDGKAFQKILRHSERTRPWLVVMGRIGVHSDDEMDIGATTENLVRSVATNVLVTSRSYVPSVDKKAHASVQWTAEAKKKMERVPGFVKGVATTAIVRWAIERGHSVITNSVINSAMGDLLPAGAAQAMGYVAEEVAKNVDNLEEGRTYICPECGYAARDFRPVSCSVCSTDGARFEFIDREVLNSIGNLDPGSIEEVKTFDGKSLSWAKDAKEVIRRVPSGYQRRRSKARVEKTARVRGLTTITKEFAIDMVEQDLAETSYLTPRGEVLEVKVDDTERPDDETAIEREGAQYLWTEAAWRRVCRVPEGFMRDMTRDKVEEFATNKGLADVNLELCEEGIAEGRKMMADMLGNYTKGGAQKEEVRKQAAPSHTEKAEEKPAWTEGANEALNEKVQDVADAGKFSEEKAESMSRAVTEERATEGNIPEIGVRLMERLGKQLGYGHPMSDLTAQYDFTWTPEAEARLQDIPDFCREMSKWRVEWTAVKKDLGTTITPEIMDVKFEMWDEISKDILNRDEADIEWEADAMGRLEKIPDFVKGQVIQSVEGNARKWGFDRVTTEVLDKVIDKWIETGDFHEGQFGYK